MTAPRRVSRGQAALRLIAIVAGCVLLTACDDGPSGPRTVSSIDGAWHGSLQSGIGRDFDPCLQPAEAAASIRQDGVRVSGTVTTASASFPGGNLEGEFRSGTLIGTLINRTEAIAVTGGATSDRLTITFFSPGQCGPNSIRLAR
jgi:hypothetical protein